MLQHGTARDGTGQLKDRTGAEQILARSKEEGDERPNNTFNIFTIRSSRRETTSYIYGIRMCRRLAFINGCHHMICLLGQQYEADIDRE